MRDSYKAGHRARAVSARSSTPTPPNIRASCSSIAVEQTRLKIPLLFGYDVIHGHRTIFPISLGEAASLGSRRDREARRASPRPRRRPRASTGPSRRWSTSRAIRAGAASPRARARTSISGSLIAAARVRGFRATTWRRPTRCIATAKHFAAYGAAQAGRDYHTIDMSERDAARHLSAAVQGGARRGRRDLHDLVQRARTACPRTGNK